MDESEWDEPENLQSVRRPSDAGPGSTPLATPRRTPSASIYGKSSADPAEKAWEVDERRARGERGQGGVEETPFDWKAAMREDGREAAYKADRRKPAGRGRKAGEGVVYSSRSVWRAARCLGPEPIIAFGATGDAYRDGDEDDEFYEDFYLQEEGVGRGEAAFLGDPQKIKEKEEAMKKAAEKGEANRRRQQQQNSKKK